MGAPPSYTVLGYRANLVKMGHGHRGLAGIVRSLHLGLPRVDEPHEKPLHAKPCFCRLHSNEGRHLAVDRASFHLLREAVLWVLFTRQFFFCRSIPGFIQAHSDIISIQWSHWIIQIPRTSLCKVRVRGKWHRTILYRRRRWHPKSLIKLQSTTRLSHRS